MSTKHPITIDLNADVGEGFGVYRLGADEELLPLVTSANIACGFHAGDPATMRTTVRLCLQHGVGIGAHPGLPDREGFGRREMAITPREAYDLIVYQVGALQAMAHTEGGTVRHVKPHGALYNMSATNAALAEAIAEAVYRLDPSLVLYGLAGSESVRAGRRFNLCTADEAFADRRYNPDGTLVPRSRPDALLHDPQEAVVQVRALLAAGRAQTVCVHGDTPEALAFARAVRVALLADGLQIKHNILAGRKERV
ncbi:LamB/YcsF family protein [Paenibacillus koleovorans]|uniref:LamB/YcsF family protein n=1 Tax=Paenibacillus koleovorans TaxID=121608 RepID=UPI000FD78B42|nr:5-oxoprolinase subunit PxpA [Paenibacillus koleovorans]